jgi:cytochrome c-type biogenesis protein CcsB
MESSPLFGLSTIGYFLAMVAYIAYLAFRVGAIGKVATGITVASFGAQTVAILLRWKEFYEFSGMSIIRSVPLTNLYESLVFFVWCLILAYLVVEFRYHNRSFGAFVTPVAGMALAFIELSGMSKGLQPLVPALQSNWLLAHVLMSFIAYATFALAFSTALMYLILTTQRRTEGAYLFWSLMLGLFLVVLLAMGIDLLRYEVVGSPDAFLRRFLFKSTFLSYSAPVRLLSYVGAAVLVAALWRFGGALRRVIETFRITPQMLDDITYKSIAIGFPIFTLGGLIFGAIWADQAWGVYWSWDPKETWSLITWFVYAFFLHARLLRGWRGHKTAVVAVVGFVAVVFTYLGVNLLLSGLHAYGGLQ